MRERCLGAFLVAIAGVGASGLTAQSLALADRWATDCTDLHID
jgi:hypothetical protein